MLAAISSSVFTHTHTHTHTHYIYIYIYIAFGCLHWCYWFVDETIIVYRLIGKNARDKVPAVLNCCILQNEMTNFLISRSNEQLQQEFEYTLLKPDCHRWLISKMQSDTLEERYAIKFCFKLGKMPQKRMECFRLLLENLAWIELQFLSGIKDSRKTGNLWGMMRDVGGVRKSEHQSWLAKGLGLGLLCWGFKGVQEEISWEEASTLQIGSVAFSTWQSTSPQLHPCHRLLDQDGHQGSSSPSL